MRFIKLNFAHFLYLNSQRPSAKECLSHRWLRRRGSNSSESGNNATKSTSSNERPSLRKYLSKSREALYERVVQRYGSRLCTSLACRRYELLLF